MCNCQPCKIVKLSKYKNFKMSDWENVKLTKCEIGNQIVTILSSWHLSDQKMTPGICLLTLDLIFQL